MTDLDLTPREPAEQPSRRGPSIRNLVLGGLIVGVLVFVLFQAVTSARVFFYNVDEAIERRDELEDRTFRMQGVVVSEGGVDEVGALLFTISHNGAVADIRHVGDEPSGLFEPGEQVVVEGFWAGEEFQSSQVLVKHSEEYIEDNPDRILDESDPAYDSDTVTDDPS
ncbi:MAG: cytochrome c maturation protein CcmE [Actinomycetota bacterium]